MEKIQIKYIIDTSNKLMIEIGQKYSPEPKINPDDYINEFEKRLFLVTVDRRYPLNIIIRFDLKYIENLKVSKFKINNLYICFIMILSNKFNLITNNEKIFKNTLYNTYLIKMKALKDFSR